MNNERDRAHCTWAQGDIIESKGFSIKKTNMDCDYCLVISHSCDIAAAVDKEPYVELLPCERISKKTTDASSGSNPRKLHISVELDGQEVLFEVNASKKEILNKADCTFRPTCALSASEIKKITRWLAARYHRQALPDNLQKLLNNTFRALKKELATITDYVLGIWVDHSVDIEGGDVFTFFIVCHDLENDEQGQAQVDNAVMRLNDKAKDERVTCEFESRSVYDFTLYEAYAYTKFYFEHISNRFGGPVLDGSV